MVKLGWIIYGINFSPKPQVAGDTRDSLRADLLGKARGSGISLPWDFRAVFAWYVSLG